MRRHSHRPDHIELPVTAELRRAAGLEGFVAADEPPEVRSTQVVELGPGALMVNGIVAEGVV